MTPVFQSVFLKALGWSLIDSLWQMGFIWLLYVTISQTGKSLNAEKRHNLALGCLALGSVSFLGTLIYNYLSPGSGLSSSLYQLPYHYSEQIGSVLPILSLSYLVATLILTGRLHRQLAYTKALSQRGLTKAEPEVRVFMKQLAAQMGIKKEIRVWISELVETPLTIGFWKPVILLPVSIINNLSLKQTETIILHELYHIRRNDFLLNLLIAVADVMLFFNPFAKFFKEVIRREREHRCDDMVLQFRYDPGLYAQALLILEKQRPARQHARQDVLLAATGNSKMFLLARVKRLLTGETMPTPFSGKLLGYLCLALFIGNLGLTSSILPVATQARVSAKVVPLNSYPLPALEIGLQFSTNNRPEAGTAPVIGASPVTLSVVNGSVQDELSIETGLANVIVSKKLDELFTEIATTPAAEYVKAANNPEYTIRIDEDQPPAATTETASLPYVPSKSFRYSPATDSASLTRAATTDLLTYAQVVRTLNSIDEIDWSDIESKLAKSGETLDIDKLEAELKKAVAEIDWKALNADLGKTNTQSAAEIEKYRSKLAERYLEYQKAKLLKEKRLRAAEPRIVEEKVPQPVQRRLARVKKIISI